MKRIHEVEVGKTYSFNGYIFKVFEIGYSCGIRYFKGITGNIGFYYHEISSYSNELLKEIQCT